MLTQQMALIAERHGHQTNVEKKNSYRLDSWPTWRILTGTMVQRVSTALAPCACRRGWQVLRVLSCFTCIRSLGKRS